MGNVASAILSSNVYKETTPLRRGPSWTYYSQVSVTRPQGWLGDSGGHSVQRDQGSLALHTPEDMEAADYADPSADDLDEQPKDADKQWGPWSLTQRELEVLQLLAEGSTNSEISNRLFISPKTTKNHLAAIFQKLDVTNRTHALVRAVIMGLVSIE
jgi:DNA-binding CsgD family transcriptional regulator